MSEASDMFRAYKEIRKQERKDDRESAPARLREAGVSFSECNNGAHLIVCGPSVLVDFWPGVGRWKPRGGRAQSHGIEALIAFCKGEATQ